MFQDEARFGRISDVRRCWAPKPLRPVCQGMLTHEYTYAYGAVDVCTGELDSLILPHVNTGCMQLFLDEVSAHLAYFINDTVDIDDDLGRSAIGMVARPGFDHLVAGPCAGEVGAVLCFDASRLARNIRSYGLRSPFSLKFSK